MRPLVTSTIKIFLILLPLFITACDGGSDSPPPSEPETSSKWGEMKWGEGTWEK